MGPICPWLNVSFPRGSAQRAAARGAQRSTGGTRHRSAARPPEPAAALRISVTDRCNFRCGYCMPKEVFDKHYRYRRMATCSALKRLRGWRGCSCSTWHTQDPPHGRRTPCCARIWRCSSPSWPLRTTEGQVPDLTLTTNGSLLARKARAQGCRAAARHHQPGQPAGRGVPAHERRGLSVAEVLAGIEAAQAAGLAHIKVNMVVKRGTNDQEIPAMARHFRGSGITLRFIEYMDVGATNGWRMDQGRTLIRGHCAPAVRTAAGAAGRHGQGETAKRWGWAGADGRHDPALGEVGVISSVTQAFCGDCNRARLSMEGGCTCACLPPGLGSAQPAAQRYQRRADQAPPSPISGRAAATAIPRLRASLPADSGAGQRRIEMSYIGG